ncbi:hypothetical protein HON36_00790 [Candidatus Parcubacteria bacterium]|nr:hypothetical protein [Candidatus Parcubacteria bacterium]
MSDKKNQGGLAIGGGVLMGVGVGFLFLHLSPLFFIGPIMIGLGLGLMVEAFIASKKN